MAQDNLINLTDLQVFLEQLKTTAFVDSALDANSNNPVRNSAIAAALVNKQDELTAGANIDITNNVVSGKDWLDEINEAVAKVGAFTTATLVNDVPDVQDPSTKLIYLTKDSSLQVTDPWTEWIFTSADAQTTAWQIIGETTVNLSGYATETYVNSQVSGKVDKDGDKVLSEVDFTSAYKEKLDSIAASAQVNVQSNWTEANTASDAYIQNKPTSVSLDHDQYITIDEINNNIVIGLSADAVSATIPLATQTDAGLMSSADKVKLDNITPSEIPNNGELSIIVGNSSTVTFSANQSANTTATIPVAAIDVSDPTNPIFMEGLMTSAMVEKLYNIAASAQVNVQSDWNQTNSASDEYIKNKPENLALDHDEYITITETANSAMIGFNVSAFVHTATYALNT